MNDYRPARWALALALPLIAGLARAQERAATAQPTQSAQSAQTAQTAQTTQTTQTTPSTQSAPPAPSTPSAACSQPSSASSAAPGTPRPRIFVETIVLELRGGAADVAQRSPSIFSSTPVSPFAPLSMFGPAPRPGPATRLGLDPLNPDALTLPGGPAAVAIVSALRQRGEAAVRWTPNVLMGEGERASVALAREPGVDLAFRFGIRARMQTTGELRLDLDEDLSTRANTRANMRTTAVVADDQTVLLPGPRMDGAGPPHTLALLVTAHVIRSPADLRALFDRRMHDRQEALDRYFVFAGPSDAAPHRDYTRTRGLVGEIREQLRAPATP